MANWLDLAGRVALVTGGGANGGIGHAVALALAEQGADVAVCDLDAAGAEQTAREVEALGRRALAVRCDVAEPAEVEAMFGRVDEAFGRIDVLVNNVGLRYRRRPEEVELAEWHRVLRANLDGALLCSQAAGRRMIAAGRGGAIVNVSSIAGSSALGRGSVTYSVTKAGILELTRELAVEWARHHIRVNAVQPAQTRTPALARMFAEPGQQERLLRGIPLGRLGEPEDVAKAVVFLASDAAAFVTGAALPVDGGNLALNAGGERAADATGG